LRDIVACSGLRIIADLQLGFVAIFRKKDTFALAFVFHTLPSQLKGVLFVPTDTLDNTPFLLRQGWPNLA
jgi:hypothetical protein